MYVVTYQTCQNFTRIMNLQVWKCVHFISMRALMNFGVNVSFLLSFQFGAFCFPLLPYFRWHHMVTHMVLLFCPIWIYVDDTYFSFLFAFFPRRMFYASILLTYVLSWHRFSIECVAFCVIFMMCALEFHVFHKSLISFTFRDI